MPIEIKDLDGGIGNIVVGKGIVTGEEYIDALKALFSQDKEKFKKYRYNLCDYIEVTMFEIATHEVELIAQLCNEAAVVNPDAVIAIAADKDITFGLSRMWQILIDETDWEVMVFRSRDDAEEWIKGKVKEKFEMDVQIVQSS